MAQTLHYINQTDYRLEGFVMKKLISSFVLLLLVAYSTSAFSMSEDSSTECDASVQVSRTHADESAVSSEEVAGETGGSESVSR